MRSVFPFPRHVLISRVDAIGDVVLTLPLLGVLKATHPQLKITFLGRQYTQAILAHCTHVDVFLNFDELEQLPFDEQVRKIAEAQYDAVLHVFPHRALAKLCACAGISWRMGTAHRWYHLWYCNRLTMMGRTKTPWHEAQLNVLLAQRLGLLPVSANQEPPDTHALRCYYGLSVATAWPEGLSVTASRGSSHEVSGENTVSRSALAGRHIIVHPGSRGSARNWPIAHFLTLTHALLVMGARVYVTGTAQEGDVFRQAFLPVFTAGAIDLTGRLNLEQLLGFIQATDALVAASTGPLHLAAALGKVALGIYPPVRPMHAGRWGPLGERALAVTAGDALCKGCRDGVQVCACVADVTPDRVLQALMTAIGDDNDASDVVGKAF